MKSSRTILFLLVAAVATAEAKISVFAAASTTDAMKEIAAAYRTGGGEKVWFNFASTGTLARQIGAGAPADVFVSANAKWMDWLEARAAIQTDSRFNFAANALVLVAPSGSKLAFDGKIDGRVAVGDFKSVPAGMYAEEALKAMGWLDHLHPKLVMASNVRTALLYVERGEAAAGIVYATDAMASGRVEVVGTFPAGTHSPIVYPVAAVSENKTAPGFLEFLKSSTAKRILEKHGFK